MRVNFVSKIRGSVYHRITVPVQVCEKYSINLGDVYLIKINNLDIPITITGNKNSKNIPLSIRVSKKLKVRKGQSIKVTIIAKGSKAIGKKRIVKKNNNEYLDLLYAIPPHQIHTDKLLYIFDRKSYIIVYSKGSSRPIKLPRYLKISEFLGEIFGLYQAEGYKKLPKMGIRLEFANSDPKIISYFLKFLKNDLDMNMMRIGAYINCYNSKLNHEKLVKYWAKTVGISTKKFQKTRFLKSKGKNAKEYGTLHLFVLSSVFLEVFLGLLNLFLGSVAKRNNLNAAFLRGLFAGDGHVKLAKYKNRTSLQMVELSLENKEEAELYGRLLSKLGITWHFYSYSRKIVITNSTNFQKLAKFRLLDLSDNKRINFWKGYKQHTRLAFKSKNAH